MMSAITANPMARVFFIYLFLLLTAILGQDVLLVPYAAEAFAMPVNATTRITALWGICFLVALGIAGALENRIAKRAMVRIGGWGAIGSFVLIAVSGLLSSLGIFYMGVILLGIAGALENRIAKRAMVRIGG